MSYVNRRENLHLAFIDLTKAFDQVEHAKLLNILRDRGVKWKCLPVLSNLCTELTAVMRGDPLDRPVSTKGGVRQDVFSPICWIHT